MEPTQLSDEQKEAERKMQELMKMVARELELIRFGLEDLISINPKAREVLDKYGLGLHISVVELPKEEQNKANESTPTTGTESEAPKTKEE